MPSKGSTWACCITFVAGIVVLSIGADIAAKSIDGEIDIWYNVPLCASGSDYSFVSSNASTNLPSAQPSDVCIVNQQAQTVRFNVPKSYFTDVGGKMVYYPIIYRSDETEMQRLRFDVRDGATVLSSFDFDTQRPNGRRLLSEEEEEEAAADNAAEVPTASPAGRKLLKGSSGGSSGGGGSRSSSRSTRRSSSSGTYSYRYWGPYGTTYSYGRRSRYGRSAIRPVADLFVNVFSTVPLWTSNFTGVPPPPPPPPPDSDDDDAFVLPLTNTGMANRRTDRYNMRWDATCMQSKGCAFTFPSGTSYTREEFGCTSQSDGCGTTPATYFSLSNKVGDLQLTVYNATLTTTGDGYPQLFFTFQTVMEPSRTAGYIMIPVGILMIILVAPCMFLLCSCSMKRKNSQAYTQVQMGAPSSSSSTADDSKPPTVFLPAAAGLQVVPPGTPSVYLSLADQEFTTTDVATPQAGTVTDLILTNNDVRRIFLGHFPALIKLDLRNNDVASMDGLASSQTLRWLDLSNNNLRSMDSGSASLLWLDLNSNDISAISPAAAMPSLMYLSLNNNSVSSLGPLPQLCPSLVALDLGNNDLTTLAGLESLTRLQEINVANNNLRDIEALVVLARTAPLTLVNICDNDLTRQQVGMLREALQAHRPGCLLVQDVLPQ